MSFHIPKGVFDILPKDPNPNEEWRNSDRWQYVESVIRTLARDYGYQEIRTPIFEHTELFQRGVGATSDIVSKEMYTFPDKAERSLTLRPEGTSSVIRAFVEKQLHNQSPIHKLFYIGPMFRYERQQAGRYRQHHQFGAEAIGNCSPEQDVEMIDFLYTLYSRLGLQNLSLLLNMIPDTASRALFREALQNYLRPHFLELSEESRSRFETNPLRILDSKDPKDRELVAHAPQLIDFLDEGRKEHLNTVLKLLQALKIPHTISHKLVRGLDYYNGVVFEITSGELGAQNSVGGGGRYDGLVAEIGGPDLPGTGFGTGIERIIQTMIGQKVPFPESPRPTIFLIPLGEKAQHTCFLLLKELRSAGIPSEMDFTQKKLKQIMRYADHVAAKYVAVIGDNELQTGEIELKEMATGSVTKQPLNQMIQILKSKQVNHV